MASNNTLALADLRQSLVSQGIDAFLVPSEVEGAEGAMRALEDAAKALPKPKPSRS